MIQFAQNFCYAGKCKKYVQFSLFRNGTTWGQGCIRGADRQDAKAGLPPRPVKGGVFRLEKYPCCVRRPGKSCAEIGPVRYGAKTKSSGHALGYSRCFLWFINGFIFLWLQPAASWDGAFRPSFRQCPSFPWAAAAQQCAAARIHFAAMYLGRWSMSDDIL